MKKHKDIGVLILVFVLGLILLFLGSIRKDAPQASEVTLETRMVELCSSVEGVGRCKVMVYYGTDAEDARVESVVVVCEGADSVEVRKSITDTLSSFFGIGTNRIRIEKMAP